MRRTILLGIALTGGCAWLGACSSVATFDHSNDGGPDAVEGDGSSSVDAPSGDSSPGDAASDRTVPAPDGPSSDASDATTRDAPAEVGVEAAAQEASADVTTDVAPDAPPDSGVDSSVDASADGPLDALADVVDAGAVEAGPPAPYCGDGGFLFCDGFEDGFNAWSGQYLSFGSIAIDTTHVHSGSYAMLSHTNQVIDAGGAYAAQVNLLETVPPHFFARFFVWEPSPQPPFTANLLDIEENYSPYGGMAFNTEPPSGALSLNTYNTGVDGKFISDGGVTTFDTWVCFELEVDTINETSHLYMNDVEVTDLAETGLNLSQIGITGVGLTFNQPNPQPAETVWIDDVALNGTRIGCSN